MSLDQPPIPREHLPPRKPWLAFVMSYFFPGLGHLYIGRPLRGILLLLAYYLLIIPVGYHIFLLFSRSMTAVILSTIFLFSLGFLIPFDALLISRRGRDVVKSRYNRLLIYAAYAVLVTLVSPYAVKWSIPYRLLGLSKIPSGGMVPTLLIGDQVVVDFRSRAVESLKRGDIVVFGQPEGSGTHHVKRVVGLGGETIRIDDYTVYIDGSRLEEPYKVHQTVYAPETWERIMEGLPASARRARPPTNPLSGSLFDFAPLKVPEDEYFLLGDNRDNSKDSRSYGPIPDRLIVGRVIAVRWSFYEPLRIRWNRIGLAVDTGFPAKADP